MNWNGNCRTIKGKGSYVLPDPPHCLEVFCSYITLFFHNMVFCWCWWWNGSRLSHRLFQFSYYVSRCMILTCELLHYHYYFKPSENTSTAARLGTLIRLKQYGLHFSNGNVALNMIRMFDLVSWFVPILCYSKNCVAVVSGVESVSNYKCVCPEMIVHQHTHFVKWLQTTWSL